MSSVKKTLRQILFFRPDRKKSTALDHHWPTCKTDSTEKSKVDTRLMTKLSNSGNKFKKCNSKCGVAHLSASPVAHLSLSKPEHWRQLVKKSKNYANLTSKPEPSLTRSLTDVGLQKSKCLPRKSNSPTK